METAMVWDGIRKRAQDKGTETPEILLARIDERTENMEEKINNHIDNFTKHEEKDDRNFAGLYKWVFIGVGIIGCLQFVILATKH